jgi:hypothetical protein
LHQSSKKKQGNDKMTIEQQANELIAAGQVCGFRFVDHAVSVGDELGNSFVWDGDEITNEELAGTCAFESWSAMVKYAQYSKGIGGHIVLITGDDAGRGTDFADEIYISNAKVVAVMAW